MRIAVLYLARHAEGLAPVLRFARSYQEFAAGVAHDLIVIHKGSHESCSTDDVTAAFKGVPHRALHLPDDGFDIGAYQRANAQIDHDVVCCLNTFSEILAPNWLQILTGPLSDPGVGIVGATASYESINDSTRLLNKAIWHMTEAKFNRAFADYFQFLLIHSPTWAEKFKARPTMKQRWRGIKARWRGVDARIDSARLDDRWLREATAHDHIRRCSGFPAFPNPHVRSSGFAVRRTDLLAATRPIADKLDACEFESGVNSLTRTILKSGRRALVANRARKYFDVADWPKSQTFRLGTQSGLLIADGRTRDFGAMGSDERALHVVMSWGDHMARVPLLGSRFQVRHGRLPDR